MSLKTVPHNFVRARAARPGVTSMLAMLYLVLFATLAIGFYAATTTAVQVAGSEVRVRRAMLAAETGMEFVRMQLADVTIPRTVSQDPADIWTLVTTELKRKLDYTPNVGGRAVPAASSTRMVLPAVATKDGGTFTVILTRDGHLITADVVGSAGDDGADTLHRPIQIKFGRATRASAIFDYGVASKSAISMFGKAKITGADGELSRGSVLSATTRPVPPLTMTGNPSISGDFSFTNPNGVPIYGNGTIAKLKSHEPGFADHIHPDADEPEFPTIDTSAFEPYVPPVTAPAGPRVLVGSPPGGRTDFTNVRVKAGANPHFSGGSVITGVLYIETPNKVTFTGGVTINGVIVVQNNPTGDVTTNTIKFGGNVSHAGVEQFKNSSNPTLASLAALSGSFLLAPKFTVTMTGNSNNVGGTIVTGKLDISGNAGAHVKGTVINLEDTAVDLTGTADIVISSTGTSNYPAGVTFGTHFAPLPDTYKEIH
jgi:hypothetical protein